MADDAVLITGGAGYIGSTIALCCANAGMSPVVVDDLSSGRAESVPGIPFYEGDVLDTSLIRRIVDEHDVTALIHCAGHIDVVESFAEPARYYHRNVGGLASVLEAVRHRTAMTVVLSSSASVYGPSSTPPVGESYPTDPGSPYARSKLAQEQLLRDAAPAYGLTAVVLRYFNPVGAERGGRSGPGAHHRSTALARMLQAADTGEVFEIYGHDYDTRDGSPERDFIDVNDLAEAHLLALRVARSDEPLVVNLGSGTGMTIRELADAVQRVTGRELRLELRGNRAGDIPASRTDTSNATRLLGFRPTTPIDESIASAWRWYQKGKEHDGLR